MTEDRDESCALVTGASSGIGRAIALALIRAGMHVHLVGRDITRLQSVAACAQPQTSIIQADLTVPEVVAGLPERLGSRLDVLVHSAGVYTHGDASSLRPEELARLDSLNVQAPLRLTLACLPKLRAASGQVVFVNSSAGLRSTPANAAYAEGKRALKTAVDKLRQELNPDDIRVLSIFLGRTDTPMQQTVLQIEGRRASPGTLMRPDDVALMVTAALQLPRSAEVTDIIMRPMRPL